MNTLVSRRHLVFVVLLFLALCPDSDEWLLSLFGVPGKQPAWCPIVELRATTSEQAWRSEAVREWAAAEVCAVDGGARASEGEVLWCPIDRRDR